MDQRIEDEMNLMADCARLNQSFLPYREYVKELDTLVKKLFKEVR